jgi:hypothetical protein
VLGKHYLTGITLFPGSTELVIGTLGLMLLAMVLLRRWLDGKSEAQTGWLLKSFQLYSAFSLTVYLLHHAVHLWPLWCYATWTNHTPTYYWRSAMSTPAALALAGVFIVACYFLLAFLERHGKYGLETLMRWVCE